MQAPEGSIPSAKMTTQPADAKSSSKNWKDYALEYKSAFKGALLLQGVLAVLTLLVLDYGQMHRAFWVSSLRDLGYYEARSECIRHDAREVRSV